jgi:hypothetical protein
VTIITQLISFITAFLQNFTYILRKLLHFSLLGGDEIVRSVILFVSVSFRVPVDGIIAEIESIVVEVGAVA